MKLITFFIILTISQVFGQVNVLDASIKLSKRTYLSHEHVQSVVTISNRGAQDITLTSGKTSWLEFKITRNGKEILLGKDWKFKSCVVPAGGKVARRVVLTLMYPLTEQGNYTARAILNPPFENAQRAYSQPQFFDVFNGTKIYSQQHGIKAKPGKIIGYQVQKLQTANGSGLYFQIYSPKDRKILYTRALGEHTGISTPQMKADGDGYFHILYPVGAKVFQYAKFDDAGKILDQQKRKVVGQGRPTLVSNAQGLVGVRNGIKFDPQEEIKKRRSIHNISQRPPFAY